MPRPSEVAKSLHPLLHETSPSWPSNHAQGAVVSWGYLAWKFKRHWLWTLTIVLALLIGYSRIYVGVHFPQDIIGGWVIGIAFLFVWGAFETPFRHALNRVPAEIQAILVVLLPCFLAYSEPSSNISATLGAFSGLGLGYVLEGRVIRFDDRGSPLIRLARSAVGLVIVFGVHLGLRAAMSPYEEGVPFDSATALLRWARYLIVGFFASCVAPCVFLRLGLSQRSESGSSHI
jgi:hypothetical protein